MKVIIKKYSLKQFEMISPLLTKLNIDPNVFSLPEEQRQMPVQDDVYL